MMRSLRGLLSLLSVWVMVSASLAQSTVFFPPQTTNPTCNGSTNGSIVFAVQGDSTDFFFSWSGGNLPTNGQPTSGDGIHRQTGLSSGTYSIFILDLNSGFDTTVFTTLNNPPPISINAGSNISNCLGQPINLTATTNAAPGSVITWTYSNSNGPQTLVGQSVTIPAFPAPQSISTNTTVSVNLTDPNGCTANSQVQVTANQVPVGSANPTAQTICQGRAIINLSSSLSGGSFTWTVSQVGATGATSGTGVVINQLVRATGTSNGTITYNIRPVSSAGCVGQVFSSVVTVKPKPIPTASPDSSSICSGTAVNILLSSNLPNSNFVWVPVINGVTGALSGTGSTINQTLGTGPAGGKVVYKVVAQVNGCDSDTLRIPVTVKATPVLTISPSDTITVCSGQTGTFNYSSSVSGSSFSWIASPNEVGGLSGTGAVNSQIYINNSNLLKRANISVSSTADGCTSSTKSTRVRVRPLPTVTATAQADTICSGANAQISLISSLTNSTFSWTSVAVGVTGNSPSGTGNQISQTLTTTGTTRGTVTYSIRATRETCQGPITTITIFVDPFINIPFSVTPDGQTICSGSATSLSFASPTTGISFSWTANPSGVTGASAGIGNGLNQTLTFNGSGNSGFVDYIITPKQGVCNGIPKTVRVNVLPQPAKPTITVSGGSSPICPGQSLTLTSNQLFGNQWFRDGLAIPAPVGTSQSLVVNQAGFYKVRFANAQSCSNTSDSIQIQVATLPDPPVITGNSGFCPGVSVMLTSSLIIGNQWQLNGTDIPGATNATFSASFGGSYTIKRIVGSCIQISDPFVVTAFTNPPQPTISGNDFLCAGATGTLTSTPAIGYQWIRNSQNIVGATTQTLDISQSGNYQVLITDLNGCSATSNIFDVQGIGANPVPTITGNNTFCPGDSTILTTDNVNPAWKNQWYRDGNLLSGDTLKTLVVKLAGVYTVTLKSPRACISTSLPTTVTLRPAPPVPTISGLFLVCPGGTTVLTSSATNGNVWFLDGSQIVSANSQTCNALAPGSYTVLVTNEEGCRSESLPFVLNATSAPQAQATFTNPTTCGGSTGQIQIAVTGGSGNFTYTWFPLTGGIVQGQQNQTTLAAGNYSVLVTDQLSGCSQMVQGIILNDPANFTLTAQVTNVTSCNGSNGRIELTMTGSNGPFAFAWNPVAGNGSILNGLAAGYYGVRVTDQISNCSVLLDSILVGSQAPPKPDIISSGLLEFCSGDSIILSTTAEGPFQWATFPGGPIQGATSNALVVKSSGNYYVRTANPAFPNCFSRSDTLTVTVNPLPANPQISSSTTTVCSGITVSISTTSILFKQWLLNGEPIAGANSQFIEVSDPGTYCLQVTDGNGCSRVGTNCRNVIVNPLPPLPFISGDNGFCPGSTARLTISPFDTSQYQYTWMRNNQFIAFVDRDTISVNIGGWYKVRALNESTSCRVFSDSVFVTAFNSPEAPTISGPTSICFGGTGVLVSSNGSTYQWFLNGNILNGEIDSNLNISQSGIYSVRISDTNGCTALSPNFVVGSLPAPVASTITGNSSFCAGSSQILTASSNANYEWLFDGNSISGATQQTLNATQFGNYQVVVSGGAGCTDTSAIFATTQAPSNFEVSSVITGITCSGGQSLDNGTISLTMVNGSGNFDFQWTPSLPNNANQTDLAAGNYAVVVTDVSTGCQVPVVNLVVPGIFVLDADLTQPTSCGGTGLISLSTEGGSGNFSFQWSGTGTGIVQNQAIQSNLTAGVYQVVVTDETSQCQKLLSDLELIENGSIVFTTNQQNPTSCTNTDGKAAAITGQTGYGYLWKNLVTGLVISTDSVVSNLSIGTYRVLVSIGTCFDSTQISLTAPANLGLTAVFDSASCSDLNGSITISASTDTTGFFLTWSKLENSSFNSNENPLTGLSSGTYTARFNNASCADSLTVFLPKKTNCNQSTCSLSVGISAENPGCLRNSGRAIANVSNSLNPTFEWYRQGSTLLLGTDDSLNNVVEGPYFVIVTDGLCKDTAVINLIRNPGYTLNVSSESATCADTDGRLVSSFVLIPSGGGGLPPFVVDSYNWTKIGDPGFSANSSTVENVSSGTYQLIFSLNALPLVQCSDTVLVTVEKPTNCDGCSLLVSAVADSATCANNDGGIMLSVSNGSPSVSFAWTQVGNPGFSAISQNLTGLSAGIYEVIATDGVCKDTLQVVVFKPANCGTCNLNVIASSNPVTCAGGSNGTALAFVVSGGAGPFSYQLNNGPVLNLPQFLAAFPNQPAGPFEVIVTDVSTSCKDTVNQVVGTQVSLVVNAFTTNPSCGFSDGQIRVVVSGGTAPYMVALGSNPAVEAINGVAIFSGLLPGNYTVSVTDGTPCLTSVSNIILTGSAPLTFAYGNVKPTTCFGSIDGALQLASLSGSSVGYSYFIPGVTPGFQSIAAGDSIKNLGAGNYTLTIRAINGCEKDTSFIITSPSKIEIGFGNLINSACQDSTGSAKIISISGGNGAPFSYSLFLNGLLYETGPSLPLDSILKNLTSGNYQLATVDQKGCSDSSSFSIGINTIVPVVTVSASKTTLCSGDTITLTALNSAFIDLPNYSWYLNGQLLPVTGGTFLVDTLETGDSIQVKINGSSDCLEPDSAWSNVLHFQVLPANANVLATINPIKTIVCIGQSATLQAFSGSNLPDLGYRWLVNGVQLPNDTSATLTLFPGLPINSVQAIVFTRSNSTCISKSRDTSDVQLVTQISGFVAKDTLYQTSPLAGQFICPNTPVSFSVKSNLKGQIPFVVQWFRNDTLVFTGPDTFYTFNGLPNNARIRAHVSFDNSLTCMTSNAGAGLDSTGTTTISVLALGDVRCLPCSLNATTTVSNINCGGSNAGSIQVSATGGTGNYRYSLLPFGPANQELPFFFGLAPGTYSILVRDTVTACTQTISGLVISVLHSYDAVVASVDPTPCSASPDGKLEFVSIADGSGDLTKYKYRINSSSNFGINPLFTGLPSGSYLMEAQDTLTGCLVQVARTLNSPESLQAFASVGSRPTCYGQFNGSIKLDSVKNGLGLVQYSLSGDPGSFTNAQIGQPLPQGFGAGSYNLYFRDLQSGCLDTVTVPITQPDSIRLAVSVLIGSQCFAPTGQFKITQFDGGTSPISMEMKYPGANIFLPLSIPVDSMLTNMIGGQYVIQAKDANNCIKQLLVDVPINSPGAQQIDVVKPCIGDTNGVIRLSGISGGTAPYTFELGDDQGATLRTQTDSTFNLLKPGIYRIIIRDSSNPTCEVSYQRTVEYPQPVQFNLVGTTNSTCENFDGQVRFVLTGGSPGYRFSFDTLATVFTNYKSVEGDTLTVSGLSNRAPEDLYTLRIFDSGPDGGCFADHRFNVPGNAPLRFVYRVRNLKCHGDNSGAISIDSLNGTGPVRVQVVDAENGSVLKEATLEGSLFFNSSLTLSGLPAGTFNLNVIQFGTCTGSRTYSVEITQPTAIEIFASQYKSSASGFALGSILLDSIRGSFKPYLVSFDENVAFSYVPDTLFNKLTPGSYTLKVTDSIGCEVSKAIDIEEDEELFVPTLFTPNRDENNDNFEIRNLPPGSQLRVSNRWGKEVFSSSDYQNNWDGNEEEEGIYFWTLKMPGIGERNGWVTLKR